MQSPGAPTIPFPQCCGAGFQRAFRGTGFPPVAARHRRDARATDFWTPRPPPLHPRPAPQAPPPRVFTPQRGGAPDPLAGRAPGAAPPAEPCDAVLVGTPVSLYATEDRQRLALEILRRDRSTKLIGICADRVYPSPRGIEFG